MTSRAEFYRLGYIRGSLSALSLNTDLKTIGVGYVGNSIGNMDKISRSTVAVKGRRREEVAGEGVVRRGSQLTLGRKRSTSPADGGRRGKVPRKSLHNNGSATGRTSVQGGRGCHGPGRNWTKHLRVAFTAGERVGGGGKGTARRSKALGIAVQPELDSAGGSGRGRGHRVDSPGRQAMCLLGREGRRGNGSKANGEQQQRPEGH